MPSGVEALSLNPAPTLPAAIRTTSRTIIRMGRMRLIIWPPGVQLVLLQELEILRFQQCGGALAAASGRQARSKRLRRAACPTRVLLTVWVALLAEAGFYALERCPPYSTTSHCHCRRSQRDAI